MQAYGAGGDGPWVTAAVVLPNVFNVAYAYHVIRAVGGRAVYGGPGSCGVAQFQGCSSAPGAGTRLSPGAEVKVVTQD